MRMQIISVLLVWVVWLTAGCTGALPPETSQQADPMECVDTLRCVAVDAGEPVHIAALQAISGSSAFLGEDQTGAIDIAVADYGDIHGHSITVTVEDSLCSAEGGQVAAQKVATNPAVAGILGTSCSSAATAALPIVSEAGLSMIAASTTSPVLTEADREVGGVWQPGYYRTAHNDLFQGRLVAEFAYRELGLQTAATIHDGSPYAEKLQAVMADTFRELGGTVAYQGAVNVGDTDMRPLLTEIAAGQPDFLFFPIFQPEGNLVAAQTREITGLEDTILIGGGGLFTREFAVNTGQAALDMYLAAPLVRNESYDALLQKWEDRHGGTPPSGYHAHMYDATLMLLEAIDAAARSDADGNLLIGLQAVRDHLDGIEGFDGITGQLTCSATGDCATGEAMAVFQITEAQLNGVWPPQAVFQP